MRSAKKNYHRPVSRILYCLLAAPIIYLAPPSSAGSSCLPLLTPPGGSTERATQRAYAHQDVRGISTHEVYPSVLLPAPSVRSYRTFSPLPAVPINIGMAKADLPPSPSRRSSFLWHYLSPAVEGRCPPVRWRGALRCPDFPHPWKARGLPGRDRAARGRMSNVWKKSENIV